MTSGGSGGFFIRALALAFWTPVAAQPSSAYKRPDAASRPAPSKPVAASLTPQQLQTERVKASIAKSPAHVVEATSDPASASIAPPRLAPTAAPAPDALLCRSLTGELGLETADIVVSSKAPQVTRGLRIQLASYGGRVEPLTVVFDDSGIATARIRSAAVGRATVRAEGPVIASGAQASVGFQTP